MRVNENVFDLALHYIGRNESDTFVCIIGAMDGVSFDETRGYISVYNWSGIFVEPMPAQFERLKLVYNNTNSICENAAISDYNGSINMLTIDQNAIDTGQVHACFGGMSAVYPPKNGLASEGDAEVVRKYGRLVEVPCITPETLFTKHNISKIDIISIDTEGHDLIVLKNIDVKKYNPKVIRIEYINLSEEDQKNAIDYLENNNYIYNVIGQNLDAVRADFWDIVTGRTNKIETIQTKDKKIEKSNTTLVTGIWDLDRAILSEGWKRDFSHYTQKFEELIKNLNDIPLIVFIDPQHENIVWKHRSRENTAVYHQTKEQFNSAFFPFFDKVQEIRKNEKWLSQTGWLRESTQAKMEWYNPVVMSKMFMLHNAKCFDPFNTDYFFWIDGGISNTVHTGYFSHDKVIDKIEKLTKKFLFICFPYETSSEIHGFDIEGMKTFARSPIINRVARGGFFGGKKEYISEANTLYYSLLRDSLDNGFMGTEESIFTLMTYLDENTYEYEPINSDGLINTFFEKVKNNSTEIEQKKQNIYKNFNDDVILYINAFNSPEQLQMVLDSFEQYDINFLRKTKKILINNSTKESLLEKYDEISKKYSFEEVRKGNLGVCRARQFAAEHFAESKSKYMMFFEDDMLIDLSESYCSFGFKRKVNNLFDSIVKIMDLEGYDFLKFSFSEFYGHNGEQWSWHNVPQDKKIEYFGHLNKKPLTKFTNIKSLNGTPYAEGEIYYCNWPHIIGQRGNKSMFLDTTWSYPYEQTWMSHIYTLTKEDKIKSALLLASPIFHNRVHFYEASERKEN
jgi:FkbM family methyltransferase